MAKALLITQCLQRDFVGPIGHHEAPPSRLHVGHAEAERLLGREPAAGPLAQLMGWVRSQPLDAIEVLHVRDWHDTSSAKQRQHLADFGDHCIAGSAGARLVVGLDDGMRANESYVDAHHLNDFVETDLEKRLEAIVARDGDDLRVAVIGVWTDAKVTFLCYELVTRLGLTHVATCSALTASSSREKHFVALDSLATLLGVCITHSPSELASHLLPDVAFAADHADHVGGNAPGTLGTPRGNRPHIALEGPPLAADDADAIAWLYRESQQLVLHPLAGGFSGACVYSVEAKDVLGHPEAPTVLKVGPRELVSKERVAFERVESVLGNDVPRLLATAEFGDRGALKYSFATMGRGGVRTLKSLYEDGLAIDSFAAIVGEVFGEVLARFTEAAQYEPCALLAHYGFSSAHAASVARNAAAIAPPGSPEHGRTEALVRFYREEIETLASAREHHYVGYVHGDLNGANVLVDGRNNVWLIDFAHTARRHLLNDLVKLENDLLFLFQKIGDETALAEAMRVVDVLLAVEDLAEPLPACPGDVHDPEVIRAYEAVRVLRSHLGRYCREDRNPLQWSVAALRYAAHTLGFDEADALQKRLALHAAAGHAAAVTRGYRGTRALEVGWVEAALLPGDHTIGMTICPGRKDRGRDLEADLASLASAGVGLLVCLLPDEELRWADVASLASRAVAHGIAFEQLPIVDQGVPAIVDLEPLLARARAALGSTNVVVHCMGGLGRSGTFVASLLVRAGLGHADAIAAVRRARGPRCIENAEQERFVVELASNPA